ncbi:MAG TPA: pyridine nucleotide-disulfide oxidoreductase, partial [Burkholderiales bacterium]|nr:pyridine nucleotide-disulfide oxidoreductase [Burkholderiales bacterium]
MSRARLLVVAVLIVTFAVFVAAGGPRYFTFDNLKAQQAALEAWRGMHPRQAAAAFFVVYVAFTALSLPAATLLTLLAGAIFGLGWGTLLVSFASAIGATAAML